MNDEMKQKSDEKSLEIFGVTNEEYIPMILQQYTDESYIDSIGQV